ncbi:MAG: dTDP-glucose 4,6-dehydratase [Pseudanabaenaceae cyanobacterium SKYGB_i_bin29]|nr:dTDP-glucose 4,6-dehydratase [Pseudanabaenaceae cyanobacterium SKYG29]MDW8421346.1 dTDP-glucose 4,6-dehydratase [Pseudanabaenaceae cyanobacterium SKYGB_i_bin29]
METWLVTGGAGFIGGNFVLLARQKQWANIVNLDKLTYAGNLQTLQSLRNDRGHHFIQGDIGNRELVKYILEQFAITKIINFAAESHVDRSILAPDSFIQTNIVGTFHLLEVAKNYWQNLTPAAQDNFRFLHVSTDEVYGSLSFTDPPFTEETPYAPNSPYSASKAAADHLVRSFHHTYKLPTLTTNCSNNYGPYQFPEKLIPLTILNAYENKPIPVYGKGENVRDWLYVTDHCEAIYQVLTQGRPGETYNIGGESEKPNLEVVTTICTILDEIDPQPTSRTSLITFVKDRPGHDLRYAINCSKIKTQLGWQPQENFASGIRKTIEWYLNNLAWVNGVRSGAYRQWLKQNYDDR